MPVFIHAEETVTYHYCDYAQVYHLEYSVNERETAILQSTTLSGLKQLFREARRGTEAMIESPNLILL